MTTRGLPDRAGPWAAPRGQLCERGTFTVTRANAAIARIVKIAPQAMRPASSSSRVIDVRVRVNEGMIFRFT